MEEAYRNLASKHRQYLQSRCELYSCMIERIAGCGILNKNAFCLIYRKKMRKEVTIKTTQIVNLHPQISKSFLMST